MEEEATPADLCRWLEGPTWRLERSKVGAGCTFVRVREGNHSALALSLGAGPTHCLALCWQPGPGGFACRSGWMCGCPEAERAKSLLVACLVSLRQSTVHLRLLVPLVKGSGHLLSLLYLWFLSRGELLYAIHGVRRGSSALRTYTALAEG